MSEPRSVPPPPQPGTTPPPPHGPPLAPGDPRPPRDNRSATWLAFAFFVAVAVAVGAPALADAEGPYQVGRVLGGSFAGLFLAVIVRAVWVRLPPGRGKPEINAAFFLLAAAITASSLLWMSIAGTPAHVAVSPQVAVTSVLDGCYGVAVYAPTRRASVGFTVALLGG